MALSWFVAEFSAANFRSVYGHQPGLNHGSAEAEEEDRPVMQHSRITSANPIVVLYNFPSTLLERQLLLPIIHDVVW